MCLYTKQPARMAKEDLTVYKTVCQKPGEDTWRGVFQFHMQFQFNTTLVNREKHDRITLPDGAKMIDKGYFHVFIGKENAVRLKDLIEYYHGFKVKAVRCIIPKGAYYYSNGTEAATRKIIVTDEEILS